MTVHNLSPLTITVTPRPFTNSQPTTPRATKAGETTRWTAFACDVSGNILGIVPILGQPTFTWDLDTPTRADFDVSFDIDSALLPLANPTSVPHREIQLYRNGHLMLWGPVVARRGSTHDRVWTYSAYDPSWYLQKRYFGEASRHNYLSNGGFDTNLTGWTTVGAGVTATQTSAKFLLGTGSAKLVGTVANAQTYIYSRTPMSAGALGLAVFVTAWVFVEAYTDQAYGQRGVYLERQNPAGTIVVDAGFPGPWAQQPLTKDSAPVGKWSRLSTYVEIPPNTTETIEVRLYAPQGTVYWDAVTLTVEESVSFVDGNSPGGTGWDQTYIAQQLVRYLGGAWPVGNPYTKTNIMLGVAGAASGIRHERTYQFFDHQNGFDALTAFTQSSDGFDWRVEVTPTVRTFRTYYPAAGTTWTQTFRYQRDVDGTERTWAVTRVDPNESIEGSASDVTEMGGWGDGAGREDGGYSDASLLGDLTLELVESAPTEASIDLLTAIATSRAAQLGRVLNTPVLTMAEPRDPTTNEVLVSMIGVLLPGDIIPLIVSDGSVQYAGNARVGEVVLNADETLTVSVSL